MYVSNLFYNRKDLFRSLPAGVYSWMSHRAIQYKFRIHECVTCVSQCLCSSTYHMVSDFSPIRYLCQRPALNPELSRTFGLLAWRKTSEKHLPAVVARLCIRKHRSFMELISVRSVRKTTTNTMIFILCFAWSLDLRSSHMHIADIPAQQLGEENSSFTTFPRAWVC